MTAALFVLVAFAIAAILFCQGRRLRLTRLDLADAEEALAGLRNAYNACRRDLDAAQRRLNEAAKAHMEEAASAGRLKSRLVRAVALRLYIADRLGSYGLTLAHEFARLPKDEAGAALARGAKVVAEGNDVPTPTPHDINGLRAAVAAYTKKAVAGILTAQAAPASPGPLFPSEQEGCD